MEQCGYATTTQKALTVKGRAASLEKNKYLTDRLTLPTKLETEVVKIGKRYTVVIPKGFREKLGVKEGQLTEVTLEKGKLVLVPKISDPFRRLSELIGDVAYDEKTERKCERWMFGRTRT